MTNVELKKVEANQSSISDNNEVVESFDNGSTSNQPCEEANRSSRRVQELQ